MAQQDIIDELNYLKETKQQIKQAIIDKGQEIEDDTPFRYYAAKIEDIETGGDTSSATAREYDVLQGKTFYAGNKKRTGSIETQVNRITGGMNCDIDSTTNSYWIADINDTYNIAVVYVYNQQNPWWIYEWQDGHLGNVLQSLSAGTYPGGTNTKNVSISKQLNSSGYLNIWCHAVNSEKWSHYMRGYIGVLQYDYINNVVIKKATLETSKPGGYSNTWNEEGNMAACPSDPAKCFVAYNNNGQVYLQMLVYNDVTNAITRYNSNYDGGNGPSYQSEWNYSGNYVLMSRGAKSHPEYIDILKINENNSMQRILGYSTTKPNTIYEHYVFIGNKLYDFSTGSLVYIKTFNEFRDFSQGTAIMWTYLNYLFISDYNKALFFCYKIDSELNLTVLFRRPGAAYVGSSYNQYAGTTVMPSSNTFLYFSPTKQIMYKMSIAEETDKVAAVVIQGDTFTNLSQINTTADKVLTGSQFVNSDGLLENGSMPNRGNLSIIPTINSQTITSGYYSGGTVEAVTSEIDNNIIADNIKKDITILGVTGTYEPTGGDATSDGSLQAKYLLEGYSAVVDGKWINGTMKNYGTRTFTPTSDDIEIPEGHYDSISIPQLNAANCEDYDLCSQAIASI